MQGEIAAAADMEAMFSEMEIEEGFHIAQEARANVGAGTPFTGNHIRYCFDPAINRDAKKAIVDSVRHFE